MTKPDWSRCHVTSNKTFMTTAHLNFRLLMDTLGYFDCKGKLTNFDVENQ